MHNRGGNAGTLWEMGLVLVLHPRGLADGVANTQDPEPSPSFLLWSEYLW